MAQKKKVDKEDVERQAIIDDSIPDDMLGLPKIGQVTKKHLGKMKTCSQCGKPISFAAEKSGHKTCGDAFCVNKENLGIKTVKKKSASERTVDFTIDSITATLDAAKKRGTSEDITEKLTDSLRIAKLDDSGILPTENEDIEMAAKKKTAKKPAKKSNGVKSAAPIGRERKLLLRLSKDEYNSLQEKAEKNGTSMANWLRTSAIG